MRPAHALVPRHLGQGGERADAQAAVGDGRDLAHPGDGLQVDHARRLDEPLLHVVQEVDAARLEHAARRVREQGAGLGDGGGSGQLEAPHGQALPFASARAARTRSGVMGSSRMRAPVAL